MSVYSQPLRIALLTATLSLSAVFTAPAQAFSDDEARRAILELREQVKREADQNRQARLQLADQMEAMQHEMARIRGQLEQLNWQADLQQRASQDQSGGNTTQVADPQEQAAYEGPMGLFRSGKYKEAAASFNDFLDAYPNSQLAPEARFYQGSSRYASKDFKGSIEGLQAMIQASPDDPRAPDALLVIAASQIELNNMSGAKASLQKIVKDYPNSSAAETAKSRLTLLQ
ncbi:tol-pal system protein YbgF [Pusillimonas sp. SM2304]|uniref:tol-pal system protein YbgF n=1 Tax=Pusillimonas sp. SM2304 TaxID=3073241 RepID=UPI002874103E|nr:tol-pal system protein YbgF [Pusillimonas sp. SM2304]MDS1142625.1 tol-pal system protein YbgF [Pusillimonas sp. SM2304]